MEIQQEEVDINDPYEVSRYADELLVTEEHLLHVVSVVGPNLMPICAYLHGEAFDMALGVGTPARLAAYKFATADIGPTWRARLKARLN